LGRILNELEEVRDRLAIKRYPILFDALWQKSLSGEVNGVRHSVEGGGEGGLRC
jgi:hypothetical protein